jgi:hypothetical protein
LKGGQNGLSRPNRLALRQPFESHSSRQTRITAPKNRITGLERI